MDDFTMPRDEQPRPAEFPAPGPEYTPVGLRAPAAPARDAGRKKKKRLIYAIAAAALVLASLGPFRLFSGGGSAAPGGPDAPRPAAPAETPAGTPAQGTPAPQTAAPTQAPAAPTETPSARPDETVVPACDIYLTSLYSEVRAKLEFRDMDDAETVTLELWDPETGAQCATWDITEPALEDGAYSPPPFTTDLIYEAQADYYSAQNEFPMRCTLKAVIAYRDGDAPQSVEFSADSVEAIFWDVTYVPLSAERWSNWVTPGCFQLKVMDSPAEAQIVYGTGTPESDVDFFVTMYIDGKPVRVDPATRYTLHDEFDAKVYVPGEEDLVDKHIHNTLLVIPMPEGFAEGEEHVATFTVRQYLPAYDTVVEFTQDVEF